MRTQKHTVRIFNPDAIGHDVVRHPGHFKGAVNVERNTFGAARVKNIKCLAWFAWAERSPSDICHEIQKACQIGLPRLNEATAD
ncbi:hypothetical protein PPGU19_071750 (plasmid) [Paraburkholderia sp. PGU19]|nr:hypothetical protein PPGU19_071750 [Paraburkholderia sp. PGU19]